MLILWLILSILLSIFYVALLSFYCIKWNSIPLYNRPLSSDIRTTVAVIVAARNEAQNIEKLLQSLYDQQYDKLLYEVIIVDDYSTDNTADKIIQFQQQHSNFQLKLVELSKLNIATVNNQSYKKQAITYAIAQTNATLILTTDADCIVPTNWIATIVDFQQQQQAQCIAAPVVLTQDSNRLHKFQALDFCGMQLITGASLQAGIFNMANGANLAYTRNAFTAVNGFHNIDEQPSGDDLLLVYKIAQQYPDAVYFMKAPNCVVATSIQPTIADFLQQRFRWTSKSTQYQDKRMQFFLAMVYFFVLSIWINLFIAIGVYVTVLLKESNDLDSLLTFLNGFLFFGVALIQFFLKSIIDFVLLKQASTFFKRKDLMKTFILSELLHNIYIVVVGTLGNILSYNWKGRTIR